MSHCLYIADAHHFEFKWLASAVYNVTLKKLLTRRITNNFIVC